MGTRGYKAWRFRKRYYYQYNHWDSYPTGLGKIIVAEIPKDSPQYALWLQDQLTMVGKWETKWLKYIDRDPAARREFELPDFMKEYQPKFTVPLNDIYIEWVYIIDLDREIFSVNNGAHFKLDRIAHVDWIGALADGRLGDKLIIPDVIPDDAVADLVVPIPPITQGVASNLQNLTINEDSKTKMSFCKVTPKNSADIPWCRRHGVILRTMVLWLWSKESEDELAATLLQWTPADFAFREFAYGILCLASGGGKITFVPEDSGKRSSFVSVLGNGINYRGGPFPGSAPEGTIFWFEGALIFLTTQLFRPQALENGLMQVGQHCLKHHPEQTVDAMLLSIEHVVLIHVIPGADMQHTPLLPLVCIDCHLTMPTTDRYASSYLQKLKNQDETFIKNKHELLVKAQDEAALRNEGINISRGPRHDDDSNVDGDGDGDGDGEDKEERGEGNDEAALYTSQVDGDVLTTGFAMFHFFNAAARRCMPPSKSREGLLPNELYARITSYVTDRSTRSTLMHVSRFFRQLCQEDYLFAEDQMLRAGDGPQDADDGLPLAFVLNDLVQGESMAVRWERAGGFLDWDSKGRYRVAVGEESKASGIPGLSFRLRKA